MRVPTCHSPTGCSWIARWKNIRIIEYRLRPAHVPIERFGRLPLDQWLQGAGPSGLLAAQRPRRCFARRHVGPMTHWHARDRQSYSGGHRIRSIAWASRQIFFDFVESGKRFVRTGRPIRAENTKFKRKTFWLNENRFSESRISRRLKCRKFYFPFV